MISLPPVRVGLFEGPLDLLLDEVRRQRVAIQDLQMAPLVARFLNYTRGADDRDLALDLEWLAVAATLIDWKARWLARQGHEEEGDDPVRDELVRLLTAYRKEIAADLANRREQENRGFSKAGIDDFRRVPAVEPLEPEPEQFLSVWDLEQKARALAADIEQYRLELAERRRFAISIGSEEVSTEEMAAWLRERLDPGSPIDAVPLLNQQASPARRSALLLATLEMCRAEEIVLEQAHPFGPLFVAVTPPAAG
jgi:segregation and condensation protein A